MPLIINSITPSTGHCHLPVRCSNPTQSNVFAANNLVVLVGDTYDPHIVPPFCPPPNPVHIATASRGSPNVFVQDKALTRQGDNLSCGDTANNPGISFVFINN